MIDKRDTIQEITDLVEMNVNCDALFLELELRLAALLEELYQCGIEDGKKIMEKRIGPWRA